MGHGERYKYEVEYFVFSHISTAFHQKSLHSLTKGELYIFFNTHDMDAKFILEVQ